MQGPSCSAVVIAENPAHFFARIYINDLHGNAVLSVVHRRHCMKVIIHIQILHDGKVEIHRLRLGAGNDLTVLHFQARIGVVILIPCQYCRLILTGPPSVQVDTDRII